MIKLIIEIEELREDPRRALNVALKIEEEKATLVEESLQRRIYPELKKLLQRPGLFGEPAQDS